MDLNKFFREKEIPYTDWNFEHNDETHFIDSDFIIALILRTKGSERKKIAGTLSVLDFKNASILDYLHYLAKCYITENSYSQKNA